MKNISLICYDTHKMTKGQEIAFFKDCEPGDLHATNIQQPQILSNGKETTIYSVGLHLSGYGWDRQTTQPLMEHFILTPVLGSLKITNIPGTLCSLWDAPRGFVLPMPIAVYPGEPFHLNICVSKELPVEVEARFRGRSYKTARDPRLTVRAFLFGLKRVPSN